jgi:hypothetical protein
MHKQLLSLALAITTLVATAQVNKRTLPSQNVNPQALMANVITYGYVANTTMVMDLTLNLTNTDGEYADSVAITFPTGITPTGTPNLIFPTNFNGGGDETYNGIISGQTITWGANTNDFYGGIVGRNLNFKVAVNVGNITGIKTGNFFVSGDGYYQTNPSGDAIGTFTIKPKLPVDLRVIRFYVPPFSCINGANEILEIWLRNDGTAPVTGNTDLSYQINSNAAITENSIQTIAAGDTLKYVFNASANLSAIGAYTIVASGVNALDGDFSNNQATENSYSYPQNALPYQTGFEATPVSDLLNWYGEDFDSFNTWDTTRIDPYSGATCMRMLEVSATSCEDYLFSSCLTLDVGKTYNLSYFKNMAPGYVGRLGVFLCTGQNAGSIIKVIQPANFIPDTNVWFKDSINFTVSSTGIYHLGFLALNYNVEAIALRLDDVKLSTLNLVGINTNASNNDVMVYPNPAQNFVTILGATQDINKIELYTVLGQQISINSTINNDKLQVPTSHLDNGFYNLKITYNNNYSIVKQLIISK